jgi:hypothetical protein
MNNLLEFLAIMINIWLILLECQETRAQEECILALGDYTTGIR